jgi:glycosyltransferase involved in cell wall biosynthesis
MQTLNHTDWEVIVVDNASNTFPGPEFFGEHSRRSDVSIQREPRLGLTSARKCGFRAARGEVVVLVDDDNVLAPDYLSKVRALFAAHPKIGAIGGKSLPEFEAAPPEWAREFFRCSLCAIRATRR